MYLKCIHKFIFILTIILVIAGLQGSHVFAAEEKAAAGQKELKFTEKM